MHNPFLFGIEWELAVGFSAKKSHEQDKYYAGLELRKAICELTPWLADAGCEAGIFTPGFRYYIDVNAHPEVASVEVRSPLEFILLRAAIFDLLRRAVEIARHRMPGLILLANNRDYISGATWGSHESYAIASQPMALAKGMLPFLATRPIIAGSGGFGVDGSYLFSPRALYLDRVTEGSTTSARAIYSTSRDEPHMGRGPFTHRLHLICGDSVRSETSEFLKLATTALVLAWLQEDPSGADRFTAKEPLGLLKEANLLASPGEKLNVSPRALAIQHSYLESVETWVDWSTGLPEWCSLALGLWRRTLRALERDPLSLCDRLDPFIKLKLFRAAAGVETCDELYWPGIVETPPQVINTWFAPPRSRRSMQLQMHTEEEARSAARRAMSADDPFATSGHRPAMRDRLGDSAVFSRLALLDLSYHTIGADSVFEELDRSGCLSHRVEQQLRTDRARESANPPQVKSHSRGVALDLLAIATRLDSRAAPRAKLIAEHSGRSGHVCTWTHAFLPEPQRTAEFLDPTSTAPPDVIPSDDADNDESGTILEHFWLLASRLRRRAVGE